MMRPVEVSKVAASLIFLCVGGWPGMAGDKPMKSPESNTDSIEVIGHLAFDGTGLQSIVTGEQFRRQYLYLSWAGKMKVVDVTKGAKPVLAHDYTYFAQPADHVQVVVGNVAVLADSSPSVAPPHVVSIMSFADPLKPRLVRQFVNVTGFIINERGPQMYVVDSDGLWVLLKKPGLDRELEQEYSRQVVYNN